jgi:hypothetical protein
MSAQPHTWDREQRRDGASEWPSTGFSTLAGDPREARASTLRRRRQKRTSYLGLLLWFLLVLALGGAGVIALARHFEG